VAANVTVSQALAPTAALVVTPLGDESFEFDASTSVVATGTLSTSTGTLDYGDGTPLENLSGGVDGLGWSGIHTYDAPGEYVATLTVTDSAGNSDSAVQTVSVAGVVAGITIAGNPTGSVVVNTQVEFALTAPVGTVFQSWSVWESDGAFETGGLGTAPGTVTHTFTAPGEYTVNFFFTNEAGQSDEASMVVTVT